MKPLILTSIAVLGLLASTASADDILLRSGRDITGVRIEDESFSKIRYKKGGISSVQSVDTADVREIRYGKAGRDFTEGKTLLASGNMGAAATAFLRAADDENAPDHIRASALAEAADALFADNELEHSLEFYSELLTKYQTSRHRPRALLGKGKVLLYQGKYQEADSAFATLTSEVQSKGLGERWGYEGEFFQLLSKEAQGATNVVDGYRDLRSRTQGDYQGISNKCSLRMGRVLLNQQPPDITGARGLFGEIIRSRLDTDDSIVAGAYNGRGRCDFAQAQIDLNAGDAEKALDKFETALLDFLRVHVSYSGVYAEQAESLYWAGQSFLNIASLDSSDAEAERRGQVLLKRCRDGYAGSEWAEKAAAER